MLFSQAFGVVRTDDDDWFDPSLDADTRLFVDPMLIWEDDDPFWAGAHQRVLDYFNEVLLLVAKGLPAGIAIPGGAADLARAERALRFREPPEFCLGFGKEGIFGSGAGEDLGKSILDAAVFAVKHGLTHVDHFEQIALFGDGIGADRISDMVCNVLKHEFAEYTRSIAERHDIPVEDVKVANVRWRLRPLSWVDGAVALPLNIRQRRRVGVLLVPERFLRELPTLDPSEFWNWAWENLNEQIRADFGDDITRNVNAKVIMRFARRRTAAVARFIQEREAADSTGYDFERDPKYLRRWSTDAPLLAHLMTVEAPTAESDLCDFVGNLCRQFKHGVERRNHYELLWDREVMRPERHCQKLFDSTVFLVCESSDVDVSPESNGGVGPVDFKFSRGATKAIAELKLAKSSSLKRNIEAQIPDYADTERTTCAWVVIIQSEPKHCAERFMTEIHRLIRKVGVDRNLNYRVVWVDARRRPSASKRKPQR